jgi:hypothetical protein
MRLKHILMATVLLAPTSINAAVTSSNTLPAGNTVDLSGFATNTPIALDDPAFTAAGIASITVTDDPSTNNEFYNSGIFGAGRALFNNEEGELIALDEGPSIDFGSPTFTIDFIQPVIEFGLRIADTSQDFATPEFQLFRDGNLIDSFLITEDYDASTAFGFSAVTGFDRVVVDVDTVGSGFGFDGAGITDLTTVVPVPAALPLMASGVAALALARRRARRGTDAGRPTD